MMMNFLIKTIFVLALTLNGAVLSAVIGRFFIAEKTGFDANADLLGWLIGGAIVFLATGLIVAIQAEGQQLKRWAIVLLLTTATLIAIPAIKHYTQSEAGNTNPSDSSPSKQTVDTTPEKSAHPVGAWVASASSRFKIS